MDFSHAISRKPPGKWKAFVIQGASPQQSTPPIRSEAPVTFSSLSVKDAERKASFACPCHEHIPLPNRYPTLSHHNPHLGRGNSVTTAINDILRTGHDFQIWANSFHNFPSSSGKRLSLLFFVSRGLVFIFPFSLGLC
jgi:hypothetical protein